MDDLEYQKALNEFSNLVVNKLEEDCGPGLVFLDQNSIRIASIEELPDGRANMIIEYDYDIEKMLSWLQPYLYGALSYGCFQCPSRIYEYQSGMQGWLTKL